MKSKKQIVPAQIKDLITYVDGSSEPPTWKDAGFNDFMERPALDNNYKSSNGTTKRWCDYNPISRTFTIEKRNSEPIALTFKANQKGEISDQAILFEVGYDLWITGIDEFQRSEIIKRCIEKVNEYGVKREINGYWFKQARRNLRDSIDSYKLSNGSTLSVLVGAFDWNKYKRTYQFILTPPK